MKCREFEDLAILSGIGALDHASEVRLEAWLASHAESREELAAWRNAVASFAIMSAKPVPPSPGLRNKLIDRIKSLPRVSPDTPKSAPITPGFQFTSEPEGEWIPGSSPDSRIKILSTSLRRNYVMLLMDIIPGGKYPEHNHSGPEELYVLSGNLRTEGRLMGPGDFLHSEPGTTHHELDSPNGCRALLVVPYTWAVGNRVKDAFRRALERTGREA